MTDYELLLLAIEIELLLIGINDVVRQTEGGGHEKA